MLGRHFAVITLTAGGVVVACFLLEKLFIFVLAKQYSQSVAEAWNIDQHLANAYFWMLFGLAVVLGAYAFSFSRATRSIAIAGIVALLSGHSLLLWFGEKDKAFDRAGNATKCYVITRDAITYGKRSGIDPGTGLECKPVTPDVVERIKAFQNGKRPERISIENPMFFDTRTGKPSVWFSRTSDGNVQLFDLMGFHPETGEELQSVTSEVVALWKKQKCGSSRHVQLRD